MTTRWSRVLLARDLESADAREALAGLCTDYWRPLYYFARRKGHGPEDAQDLTQGFIMQLLASNSMARADQSKGRFRTFLISAFSNHIANHVRDQTAQKRGGHQVPASLHDEGIESSYAAQAKDWLTPERQYEKSWALALLERVMQRLGQEYSVAGRQALYEKLQPHLAGGGGRPGYAGLGQELGMSEGAINVAVHRMRKRYGQYLREEIAATVTSSDEVEDELRHLMEIVSS